DLPLYYGNYHMGGYEFVSPGLGTFNNAKSNVIPFSIKNLKPGDKIGYAFSRNNTFKDVKPVLKDGMAEFEVLLDNNSNGFLTIYINEKSVASYRINRG